MRSPLVLASCRRSPASAPARPSTARRPSRCTASPLSSSLSPLVHDQSLTQARTQLPRPEGRDQPRVRPPPPSYLSPSSRRSPPPSRSSCALTGTKSIVSRECASPAPHLPRRRRRARRIDRWLTTALPRADHRLTGKNVTFTFSETVRPPLSPLPGRPVRAVSSRNPYADLVDLTQA